jgi:hypothetical protein
MKRGSRVAHIRSFHQRIWALKNGTDGVETGNPKGFMLEEECFNIERGERISDWDDISNNIYFNSRDRPNSTLNSGRGPAWVAPSGRVNRDMGGFGGQTLCF